LRAPPAARLVKSVAGEDFHHAETVGNCYHAETVDNSHGDTHAHSDADAHAHSDTHAHSDADAHHGDSHGDSDHGDISASLRHRDTDGDGQRHGGERSRSGDRLDGSDHSAGRRVHRGHAVGAEP
jgi:hypothetical protein